MVMTTPSPQQQQQVTSPSPQQVGREFVRQYYTILHDAPELLHRFYSSGSTFVHGGVDRPGMAVEDPVVGQLEINKKILMMNFKDCHTKIRQVDSQATIGNGVVVQVTGELSNNGEPMRRFMQTFVLAPQTPKKYYVHNDIFRYQDEVYHDISDTESEDTHQQAVVEPKAQSSFGGYYNASNEQTPSSVETEQSSQTASAAVVDVNGPATAGLVNGHSSAANSILNQLTSTSAAPAPAAEQHQQQQQQQHHHHQHHHNQHQHQAPLPQRQQQQHQQQQQQENTEQHEKPVTATKDNTEGKDVQKDRSSWAKMISSSSDQNSPPVQVNNSNTPLNFNQGQANQQPQQQQQQPNKFSSNKENNAANKSFSSNQKSSTGHNGVTNKQQPAALNHTTTTTNKRTSTDGVVEQPQQQQQQQHPSDIDESEKRSTFPPSSRYPDGHQVFVGNLDHELTEQELREHFSQYGPVVEVRINTNMKQMSGGRRLPNYGFVVFEDRESVNKLLSSAKANNITYTSKKGIKHRLNVEEKRTRPSNGGGFGGNKPQANQNRTNRSSSNGSRGGGSGKKANHMNNNEFATKRDNTHEINATSIGNEGHFGTGKNSRRS